MILLVFLPLQWSAAAVASCPVSTRRTRRRSSTSVITTTSTTISLPLSPTGRKDQTVHFDCAVCLAHVAFIDDAAPAPHAAERQSFSAGTRTVYWNPLQTISSDLLSSSSPDVRRGFTFVTR